MTRNVVVNQCVDVTSRASVRSMSEAAVALGNVTAAGLSSAMAAPMDILKVAI